jgi:hypothetical protein
MFDWPIRKLSVSVVWPIRWRGFSPVGPMWATAQVWRLDGTLHRPGDCKWLCCVQAVCNDSQLVFFELKSSDSLVSGIKTEEAVLGRLLVVVVGSRWTDFRWRTGVSRPVRAAAILLSLFWVQCSSTRWRLPGFMHFQRVQYLKYEKGRNERGILEKQPTEKKPDGDSVIVHHIKFAVRQTATSVNSFRAWLQR